MVFVFINLAKDGERAMPIRHDGQKLVSAPFEGDPTYRSIFFLSKFLIIS
jgi:hypothetical protein